jgi:hypothetical protein
LESEILKKSEAIDYLKLAEKTVNKYHQFSKEIKGYKKNRRWYFKKSDLDEWEKTRQSRTVILSLTEYERCFEFALKMVYGGLALHGIRGKRSEVQATDDVILGILAEHAIKKFLKKQFNTEIELDEGVHTSQITPQDFHKIFDGKSFRPSKLGVGVKASKLKNAYLVLGSNEVERVERKSDVYIFARVDLPSDHLFRILRDHSFFKGISTFLKSTEGFRELKELKEIPVTICGITYLDDLEKVTEIPGQKFDNGHRYVKSVGKMLNSDKDWNELIKKL